VRVPALVVISTTALAVALLQPPIHVAVAAPGVTSAAPGARLAVRSGDPTPATARVPEQLRRPGFTVDGGVIFADPAGTAVFRSDPGTTTVLAYVGERYPGGTIASLHDPVPAPDGSVIAMAASAAGGYALVRLPAGGGTPEVLLASGQELVVQGGTAAVGYMYSPAVDGAGRVVVLAWLGDYPGAALVRVPPSGAPEVLLRDGDPLGGATVRRFLSTPGVNDSGTIAFAAELTSDVQVIATLAAGAVPVVLQSLPIDPALPSGPLAYAGPSINNAGDLAFLWTVVDPQPVVGGTMQSRVQRIRGGVLSTIAEPGSPAPDGDTFTYVVGMPPVIDAQGRVLFSAARTTPPGGLYRFDEVAEVIAEFGGDAGNGATFTWMDAGAEPALGTDGSILFASWDTTGYGLFSRSGAETREVVRAGDLVAGPARFASFWLSVGVGGLIGPGPPPPVVAGPFPHLGVGPFLSPGGRMIFDATVTGHVRGLFVREPDGTLATVAMAGDAAPGGGHYDGYFFSHHSVNDAGMVAFLAKEGDGFSYSGTFIAYGPMAGPLTEVIAAYDPVPDSDELVQGFPPPSRINAAGSLAIPLYLTDGTVVLYGWDGSQLVRVAGPGDVIPVDGEILSIVTGASSRLHSPLLDDAGDVVFEAIAAYGGHALYRAPLRAGGAAEAVRLVGEGDSVEDGALSSFSPQAYDRDAGGWLAFQTPPPGAAASPVEAATYLQQPGAAARRVVGPGDVLPDVGSVEAVVPHLAMAGNGRLVHEVAGPWLLVSTPAPAAGSPARAIASIEAPAGFETAILAGPGWPSPDGGTYMTRYYLLPDPPPPPTRLLQPRPGTEPEAALLVTAATPDRLATDGGNLIAWQAWTTAGPESIVIFDLTGNHTPIADAGTGQVVECAGHAGTAVTLDAGASSDPDGDTLNYEWSGPFGTASGPRPVVTVPPGTWTITLTVRDTHGASSSAMVDITIRDTRPPTAAATAAPSVIWPPNGRMVPILVTLATQDVCDPAPAVRLVGITVNDRKGGDPAIDISGAAFGTDDRSFEVRARRTGGHGRTYTGIYEVADRSGNSAAASAAVLVPAKRRP